MGMRSQEGIRREGPDTEWASEVGLGVVDGGRTHDAAGRTCVAVQCAAHSLDLEGDSASGGQCVRVTALRVAFERGVLGTQQRERGVEQSD